MRRKGFPIAALAAVFAFAGASSAPRVAAASVSLKNGNFFIGYTDIVYSGGLEPQIERVYNSKSPYSTGLFGWGWGSAYEIGLKQMPDGSIVVAEYGGGAQNVFVPPGYDDSSIERCVDKMMQAARRGRLLAGETQAAAHRKRLKQDSVFRLSQWEQLREKDLVDEIDTPVGTRLTSSRFGHQGLTRTPDGFVREHDSGRSESFDVAGRLVRIADKNGNSIVFTHSAAGKLRSFTDNFGRSVTLTLDARGHVVALEGDQGKKASYRYNERDELVYSRDAGGNVYEYAYDDQGRHNMIRIAYADKTTLDISYYGREQKENVRQVKDRDGSTTEYEYSGQPTEEGLYAVTLRMKDAQGSPLGESSYEYWGKASKGSLWTERMVTTIDGEVTDTTYAEGTGLPLSIKRGRLETRFQYDEKGRVIRKETWDEVAEFTYEPRFGKVTRVRKYPPGRASEATWSEFAYDTRGNLVHAVNSEQAAIDLAYDATGRISTLTSGDGRKLSFLYDTNSKPIEIELEGVGKIVVTYRNGEIEKVASTAGRAIAMKVTSAFQELLDIIRPAGVTLGL